MVTPLFPGPWYNHSNVKARKIRRLKKMVDETHDPYMKYAMRLSLEKEMLSN